MKKIESLARRAIEDFDMIDEGDRIAVGVSGGKDSIALFLALNNLSKYYPKKFSVCAITLDIGYHADFSGIERLCEKEDAEYHLERTDIKDVVFDIRHEKNPCSLCAKMRRAALNNAAISLGCKKVALGHHMDDVIDTFFLSMLYEGRLHTFGPVTHLDRTGIYQIRPLVYVPERDIKGAARRLEFPIVKNPCPADGATRREDMRGIVKDLEARSAPGLRKRIFTAIRRSGIEGWK